MLCKVLPPESLPEESINRQNIRTGEIKISVYVEFAVRSPHTAIRLEHGQPLQ